MANRVGRPPRNREGERLAAEQAVKGLFDAYRELAPPTKRQSVRTAPFGSPAASKVTVRKWVEGAFDGEPGSYQVVRVEEALDSDLAPHTTLPVGRDAAWAQGEDPIEYYGDNSDDEA